MLKIEFHESDAKSLFDLFHDKKASPPSPHNRKYLVEVDVKSPTISALRRSNLIKVGSMEPCFLIQWDTGPEAVEKGTPRMAAKLNDLGRLIYDLYVNSGGPNKEVIRAAAKVIKNDA
jgi:hypothetical protein